VSSPEGVPAGERPCQLHGSHRPPPLVTVKHHVQPLGMGGPDDPTNWLWTCDTGHRNVHALLGPLANGGVMPAGGTRTERAAAARGFAAWVRAGRPGNPHAAWALTRGGVDDGTGQGRQ
jgi:hypothetical protein